MLDSVIGILQQDNDVAIFTLDYKNLRLPNLDTVPKCQIRAGSNYSGRLWPVLEKRRIIRSIVELKRWHPDIVILNKNCGLAGWMSRQVGVPLVAYLHDSWSLFQTTLPRADQNSLEARSIRFLYKCRHFMDSEGLIHQGFGKTCLVVCPGEWLASELRKKFPHVRSMVIPNGIDHSTFEPTWENNGYALCAGRLSRDKKFELAVEAARISGQSLIICGSTGQGLSNRKAMSYVEELQELGGDNVRFELDISDDAYVELLQGCSVFLNPGLFVELGFGLAPMEAMACGKAVIASNKQTARKTSIKGVILLEEDVSAWASELKRIMTTPGLRDKLSQDAFQLSNEFTWERTARELQMALARLTAQMKEG